MGTEIERKFLVINDTWRAAASHRQYMVQGYLANTELGSVRVRVSDAGAFLTIKCMTLDVTRTEYEYPIPVQDAREILQHLCPLPLVEKTRHYVPLGCHVWEVDVFEGDNAGLVVAELELQNAEEGYQPPAWLGTEVSGDPRYYNVNLAHRPFRDW